MAEADFDALLKSVPENHEVRKSLRSVWDQQSLKSRQLLFFADTKEHGTALAKLAHDSSKVVALTLMLHAEKEAVMRGFAASGGIEVLAAKVGDPDTHIRAHAVELLLKLTADEHWFQPIHDQDVEHMHRSLVALADSVDFVESLLENRYTSYPGGELACLELLAFWLGWLRHQHTEDRRLAVSRDLVSGLSEWARLAREERNDDKETELATRLFEDFVRMPRHDGLGHVGGIVFGSIIEPGPDGAFELSSPPPVPVVTPRSSAFNMSAHERGNHLFALGDLSGALEQFGVALSNTTDAKKRACLLCNRATCYLNSNELERCESECRQALHHDSHHVKARYRLAQCLSRSQRIFEAIDAAKAALQGAPDNTPVRALLVDLLQKACELQPARLSKHQLRQAQLVKQLVNRGSSHEMLDKPNQRRQTTLTETPETPAFPQSSPSKSVATAQRDHPYDSDDDDVFIANESSNHTATRNPPCDTANARHHRPTKSPASCRKKGIGSEDRIKRALAGCFA